MVREVGSWVWLEEFLLAGQAPGAVQHSKLQALADAHEGEC